MFCCLPLNLASKHALNGFAAACDIAGMKINTFETKVLRLSRNLVQCSLQVGGGLLKQVEKFKYREVAFTSDGRQAEELDIRSDKTSAVMRALHRLVILKRELSRKAKFSVFKLIVVPIFIYGHET